jgi:uncharacterized protein YpuA (DUF1002 family)
MPITIFRQIKNKIYYGGEFGRGGEGRELYKDPKDTLGEGRHETPTNLSTNKKETVGGKAQELAELAERTAKLFEKMQNRVSEVREEAQSNKDNSDLTDKSQQAFENSLIENDNQAKIDRIINFDKEKSDIEISHEELKEHLEKSRAKRRGFRQNYQNRNFPE